VVGKIVMQLRLIPLPHSPRIYFIDIFHDAVLFILVYGKDVPVASIVHSRNDTNLSRISVRTHMNVHSRAWCVDVRSLEKIAVTRIPKSTEKNAMDHGRVDVTVVGYGNLGGVYVDIKPPVLAPVLCKCPQDYRFPNDKKLNQNLTVNKWLIPSLIEN